MTQETDRDVAQVGVGTDPNRVTTYTYSPKPTAQGQTPGGLVATVTDPRGIVTAFTYNAHGLPTQIVYVIGQLKCRQGRAEFGSRGCRD